MGNTVRYEKQDNIAIVTIDRPEALNALNGDVIAELEQVVTALENDRDVRCLILTGEGRSFVAGADIGEQYPLDAAAAGAGGAAPCSAASKSWSFPPSPRSTASPWAAVVSWR